LKIALGKKDVWRLAVIDNEIKIMDNIDFHIKTGFTKSSTLKN